MTAAHCPIREILEKEKKVGYFSTSMCYFILMVFFFFFLSVFKVYEPAPSLTSA